MKLWSVTVALDVAVLAETAEEAKRIALREQRDLEFSAVAAESDGTYPGFWSEGDYVYGNHAEDITLADAVQRFVPPEKRLDLKLKQLLSRSGA